MTMENSSSGDCAGRLFIISAPSGAGKSTLCQLLRERLPDLRYSVSTTTRPPRNGEIEGRDYFFTDVDSFQSGVANHQWAEWAEVHGHYYGTSAAFIDAQRAAGHDLLLDIDVQGAAQLRAKYPDAVSIFIMPPSLAVLRQRLEKRGADAPEVIEMRLANARREMGQHASYQYTIVNDRLEEALADLLRIVGLPAVGGDGGDSSPSR
jgi:guanylate kinase